MRKGETAEEYAARQAAADPEIRRRTFVLIHALSQAALAVGLLELRPWKPRTVGALGVIASVMNCYMLFPTVPRPWWPIGGLFKPGALTPRVAAPPADAPRVKAA